MDFIFGIIFVLLIIFIVINYLSISVTNNGRTTNLINKNDLDSQKYYNNNRIKQNHRNYQLENEPILTIEEESYNYKNYFYI